MKKNILILFVICLSCTEQEAIPIDFKGIYFECPAGWKVTEKDDYGTSGFISVEKKGFSSSGLVTITFTDEEVKTNDYLNEVQETFFEQKIFSNIAFEPVKQTEYGSYPGISSAYSLKILSVKFKGEIYIFQKNDRTVAIVHQGAIEDYEKNKAGFETIKESVVIKSKK